jgi:8-oxo-dGTP diphosphatase
VDSDEPVVCAGAVIRDADNRLLLVRRKNAPALGMWSLPGGRVEPGETHAEAAAREVLEETGLTVVVGDLIDTVPLGQYVVHDFTATVVSGELRAGDDASDVKWCDPGEIPLMQTSPGLVEELRRMGAL